jgi:MerR family regulatory protein
MDLSIGEVARLTGLPVKTIRYYSDIGLVAASSRTDAGYRRYDEAGLARLELIRALRSCEQRRRPRIPQGTRAPTRQVQRPPGRALLATHRAHQWMAGATLADAAVRMVHGCARRLVVAGQHGALSRRRGWGSRSFRFRSPGIVWRPTHFQRRGTHRSKVDRNDPCGTLVGAMSPVTILVRP